MASIYSDDQRQSLMNSMTNPESNAAKFLEQGGETGLSPDITMDILNKYAINQINGSKFDPLSIMLYFFPANLTTNNEGTSQNLRLSGDDALWLNKTYPGSPETPSIYYPKVYGMTLQKSIDKSKSMNASSNSKIWIWIILLIAVLLIIFLIWKFIL